MNNITLFRAAARCLIVLQLLLIMSPVSRLSAATLTPAVPDPQVSASLSRSPFSSDRQDDDSADLPYSSAMMEGAGLLTAGNTPDAAASLAAGEASGALQAWLRQYGSARIQLNVDRHGNWSHSSGDLLLTLYDNQRSMLFVQGEIRKPDDWLTDNLGWGVRTFW
ncbi:hypothetical protein NG99_23260, partial [Erwinia typographi]